MAQATPRKRRVTFALEAPDATEVSLVGNFNDWSGAVNPMKRGADGIWKRSLLLAPGRYEYKFLVDGRWWEDPTSSSKCANPYGTCNDVLEIAERR